MVSQAESVYREQNFSPEKCKHDRHTYTHTRTKHGLIGSYHIKCISTSFKQNCDQTHLIGDECDSVVKWSVLRLQALRTEVES